MESSAVNRPSKGFVCPIRSMSVIGFVPVPIFVVASFVLAFIG